MQYAGSVTLWIDKLKEGDGDAAQAIWERFYLRLIGLARRKLGDMPRRVVDEDDVVATAFQSFCQRAQDGQFPQLTDRDDLWSLLVVITARKAINEQQRQLAVKRGGGRVQGESVLGGASEGNNGLAEFIGEEPSAEFAAHFAETFETFMDSLDDPTHRLIVLWKLEGWTNPEIAKHLDCSLSAVERKLRMIRKLLTVEEDT